MKMKSLIMVCAVSLVVAGVYVVYINSMDTRVDSKVDSSDSKLANQPPQTGAPVPPHLTATEEEKKKEPTNRLVVSDDQPSDNGYQETSDSTDNTAPVQEGVSVESATIITESPGIQTPLSADQLASLAAEAATHEKALQSMMHDYHQHLSDPQKRQGLEPEIHRKMAEYNKAILPVVLAKMKQQVTSD